MPNVVTLGETMVLLTPTSVGPLRSSHLFEKTIGGSESNLAIALTRLGHSAGWISRLGQDDFGLYINHFIRGEGVDTSQVIFDGQHPTGVFFKERQNEGEPKIFYYRKGSAASRLSANDINPSYLSKADFLHVSGITPALSDTCKEAVHYAIEVARKQSLPIVFDPNIRLKLWDEKEAQAELYSIASKCDIVMPGLEEGEILTGEKTPEKIADALLANGAKVVVIKLGDQGAFYAADCQAEYIPGYEVKRIVDPIGAGDGFAAGFLSGLIRKWPYAKAVQLANRVGAYALTVTGDVEGYPYWSQLQLDPNQKEIYR